MLIFWYMAVASIFRPSAGCARNSTRPPCRRSQLTRGTTASGVTAVTSPRVQPRPARAAGSRVGRHGEVLAQHDSLDPAVGIFVGAARRAWRGVSSIKRHIQHQIAAAIEAAAARARADALDRALELLSFGALVTSFTVPPMEPEP